MSDESRREQRGLDADTRRLQSRPRLEAELGGEQTADLGVRVERVGLATGAVQREHQLLPRAIAIGMLRDDRPKLADHVGGRAELRRARTSASASSSRHSSSSRWGSAANGASASAAARHSPSASVASRRASPASPPAST
jgi:hypothetical protein